MYQYDRFDHQMLADRNAQFRGQVERRLRGETDRGQRSSPRRTWRVCATRDD